MRKEVMTYIQANNDLKQFIREQPYWYRKLSREPESLEQFEIAAMNYLQKTIPHRVEKFANSLQMAQLMMSMLQSIQSSQ